MKILFLILTAICITVTASAQKNFQGEITYKLHAENEDKPDAELKIIFGSNKLKIRFKEKEDYDNDELIIRLDSAATYTINREAKNFKKKMLVFSSPVQAAGKKTVAGYSTTPTLTENTWLGSLFGGAGTTSSTTLYIADSLYYYIPAAFTGNMEFAMVQKNKIVLGAEIQIRTGANEMSDPAVKTGFLITAEAIDIKPMEVSDDVFAIPADFTDRKNIVYDDSAAIAPAVADTAYPVAVDSVVTAPKKTTAKKAPAKPVKSKTTVKPAAVRRKEQ